MFDLNRSARSIADLEALIRQQNAQAQQEAERRHGEMMRMLEKGLETIARMAQQAVEDALESNQHQTDAGLLNITRAVTDGFKAIDQTLRNEQNQKIMEMLARMSQPVVEPYTGVPTTPAGRQPAYVYPPLQQQPQQAMSVTDLDIGEDDLPLAAAPAPQAPAVQVPRPQGSQRRSVVKPQPAGPQHLPTYGQTAQPQGNFVAPPPVATLQPFATDPNAQEIK